MLTRILDILYLCVDVDYITVQSVSASALEVLRGDKRVDELLAAPAEHGMDLATGAAEVLVVVEGLPAVSQPQQQDSSADRGAHR
jgi:hypothetical protein